MMKMRTVDELNDIWKTSLPGNEGFLLADDEHPLDFHIGYNNGQRCLIIMNTGKIENVISSKAIKIDNQIMNNEFSLILTLMYEPLEELFTKLCWDLMYVSKSSKDPTKDMLVRFSNWQKLLQKIPDGLLSSNSQKGLIGELLFFEEILKNMDTEEAINAWTGPDGSDQDFEFSDIWVEVKATSISSDSVNISSLQQLDRGDNGMLSVYFLDKTTSNGDLTMSLYDVYSRIHSKLENQSNQDIFNCKLVKVGFFVKDLEKYKQQRFKLTNNNRYTVNEAFPRLTKNNITNGIIQAKYSISLSAIERFKIEEK